MTVGNTKSCTFINCKQSEADPMAIKISIAGTKVPAKDWNFFYILQLREYMYIYSLIQQYMYVISGNISKESNGTTTIIQ